MACENSGIVTFQKQNVSVNTDCIEEESSGDCSDCRFEFTAATPSLTWIIVHPLNCFPSITVLDIDGNRLFAGEKYINTSRIEIHFNEPIMGSAKLN